jgi:hypothetical protein
MDYLAFDVSVDARGDGEYEVSARAPSGEARARVRFPFTPEQLAAQRDLVRRVMERTRAARDVAPADTNGSREAVRRDLQQLGQMLFQSVLTGKVLVAWRASGALAERDGRGLRLQLRLQAPEMAALPWELMYDPDDACFVCLNPSTPLVRYPELDHPPELLTVALPLRVLGMIASPSNLPQLDKAAERRRIERALRRLQRQGLVELTWMEGGTYRHLQAAMREGPWHVFHFIGHGGYEGEDDSGEGVLALETTASMSVPVGQTGEQPAAPPGPAQLISADLVAQLLRGHASLRLVLLNSCLGARASSANVFSSTASTLVRRGIPAVVAMQNEITDGAAVTFAQAFYTSLAASTPVEGAVADARTAISAENPDSVEWGTPVLLMRSPSGVLFTPKTKPDASAPAPDQPLPPTTVPPRNRVAPARLAGVVAVPIAVVALLAAMRAPGVELALDAKVSQVAVTIPSARSLAEPLDVAWVGASGLATVDLPTVGGGIATDRVLLSALPDSARPGRLSLDLSPRLPAGTRIALATSDDSASYQLTLGDSVPDLSVSVLGRLKVVVPDSINRDVQFTTPAFVRLHAEQGTVGLEFRPAAGARMLVAEQLPADGLDLIRVDRFESPTGTEHRERSTIMQGQLALDGGTARPVGPGDQLRAGGVRGQITRLELAGDYLELAVRGRADHLTTGSGAARRNLMPSLLSSLMARHGLWLAGAALLYAAGASALLLAARRGVA